MDTLKIITNHHKRDILYWHELSDKERLEFDWIIDNNHDPDNFMFFRYKDNIYCLSEFELCNGHFPGNWDAYMSDSFFSGILVKYPLDEYNDEFIVVGWYYS